MNIKLVKVSNTTSDLLIWVGLWNIYENILSRFSLNKNQLLLIYLLTIVGTVVLIYTVNNKFNYTHTLYDEE